MDKQGNGNIRNEEIRAKARYADYFSFGITLLLMLVYVAANEFLPCGCVLQERDPRGALALLASAAWLVHSVLYLLGKRSRLQGFGVLLGPLYFVYVIGFTHT